VLVAVVALSLAACAGASSERQGQSTTGSAVFLENGELLSGFNTDAPATVVFGSSVLRNESGLPLTLRAATLHLQRGAASGARVFDSRLLDLSTTHDLVGVARGSDPRYLPGSLPVQGFRLGPGQQVQVLYVIKVDQSGQYQWDHPTVAYSGLYGEGEAVSRFQFEICPKQAPC
jgi:hypothetical protein